MSAETWIRLVVPIATFAAGIAVTWIWNRRNVRAADRRQALQLQHERALAEDARSAAEHARFDEVVRPLVTSVLASARLLQAAVTVRAPIRADEISLLDSPIDLFDLHAETRELSKATTDLRHHAMLYRPLLDQLSARQGEMKEATRFALRPDLGAVVIRLSEEVGARANKLIAAAAEVRAAASRLTALVTVRLVPRSPRPNPAWDVAGTCPSPSRVRDPAAMTVGPTPLHTGTEIAIRSRTLK